MPAPDPPTDPPRPPAGLAIAWEQHVGERIVVRTRTATGFVDVLGDLLEVTEATLLVRTRRGEREVARDVITAGHPVPPAPARAAPPHRALSVGDLELLMAEHWVAPDQDWLGGWLLRSASGFTNRANSVLAVGEPGMPMDSALTEVVDWYTDRGQRPAAATPEPGLGEDHTAEQLLWAASGFRAAGWAAIPQGGAHVMTAPTGALRQSPAQLSLPAGLRITLDDAPGPAWLSQYHYKGQPGAVPDAGRALLQSAPSQAFVSVLDGPRTVGIARVSVARRWAGVTAVEVDAQHRRQGLASALMAAACDWAWGQGCMSVFIQVGETNEAAQTLYRTLGFEFHHTYEYLTPPT